MRDIVETDGTVPGAGRFVHWEQPLSTLRYEPSHSR